MRPRPWRPDLLWGSLTLALLLAPLGRFAIVPATDLPQHVAMSSLLWRLLHHESFAQAHYCVAGLGTPYQLGYALMTPAIGFLGPWRGARVFFVILAILLLGGLLALFRQRKVAAPWLLYTVFIFYSATFYWGFISTLTGLPMLTWGAWTLGRDAQSPSGWAVATAFVCGILAVAAHVFFVWPALLMGLTALWRRPQRPAAAVALLAGAATVLIIFMAPRLAAESPSPWRMIAIRPTQLWTHVLGFVGPFDHGIGRLAHGGALTLLAAATLRRIATAGAWQRGMGLAAGLLLLTFVVCPRALLHGRDQALMLNFRFLGFAELMLLFGLPEPTHAAAPHRRAMLLRASALALAAILFASAQWRVWGSFNRQLRPIVFGEVNWPTQNALPEANLAHVWPPLGQHVGMYEIAVDHAYRAGLFTGRHLPIVDISP